MDIRNKLRFRRTELNISRNELAKKVHVTPSAIANYENGVSYPKPDILIALMQALQIDANYLYQDYLSDSVIRSMYGDLSFEEKESLTRYRLLTEYGKKLVRLVIDEEYQRMQKERWVKLPCCLPGERKEYSGFLMRQEVQKIQSRQENIPEGTDFCFQIQVDCYEPVFRNRDVIALSCRPARHNELGIFKLNGVCYIRSLYLQDRKCRLCSLNVMDSDIEVSENDTLSCVGTILGQIFGEIKMEE